MEMIIGGAYQGKTAYARQRYPELEWVDGASVSETELMSAQGVLNFQDYIRRELKEDRGCGTCVHKAGSLQSEGNAGSLRDWNGDQR